MKSELRDGITLRDGIAVKKRAYLSISHIQAAALFARLCARVEMGHHVKLTEDLFYEHRSYVTGAILSASSFVEATINELFADAAENQPGPHGDLRTTLDPDSLSLMGRMWKLGIPRTAAYPIVGKFQIALALAKKPEFDPATSPFQDVALLVKLRNAIVHYEPELVTTSSDIESEPVTQQKLEKQLYGRFPPNPLTSRGNPFFPDKCLGHGCAAWAVTSVASFADEFFSKMGLTPTFDHIRSNLQTE